jgi:hypothetical protein
MSGCAEHIQEVSVSLVTNLPEFFRRDEAVFIRIEAVKQGTSNACANGFEA